MWAHLMDHCQSMCAFPAISPQGLCQQRGFMFAWHSRRFASSLEQSASTPRMPQVKPSAACSSVASQV